MLVHPRQLVRQSVLSARAVRFSVAVDIEPISTEPVVPNGEETSHGLMVNESHRSQYLIRTHDNAQVPFLVIIQSCRLLDSTTPFFAQNDDVKVVYGSK
jgi:hypothetical protein